MAKMNEIFLIDIQIHKLKESNKKTKNNRSIQNAISKRGD